MQGTQTNKQTLNISREKLVSFVNQIFGGESAIPDPENPPKPGPWDPLIRRALERMKVFGPFPQPWQTAFGPRPEPWHSAFGPKPEPWNFAFEPISRQTETSRKQTIFELFAAGHPEIWDILGNPISWATLNPQPLPPRVLFIAAFAEEVFDRAVLMQEIADAMPRQGEQKGIIIVSGYLRRFIDDLCPEPIKINIPKPKRDEFDRLSALELLTAAAVFEQNAASVANEDLREEFASTVTKLLETGIARM